MKVQVTYRSMSTSLGLVRNDDIIDLPDAEVRKILALKPRSLKILPELPLEEPKVEIKLAPKPRAKAKKSVKSLN